MNRTTNIFIIGACSVIIGSAAITAYNYFQAQHRQNALDNCKKDKEYSSAIGLSERLASGPYPDPANAYHYAELAKNQLNKCLGKYGLEIK